MKKIILEEDEGYVEQATIDGDFISIETLEKDSQGYWYSSCSFTLTVKDFKKIADALGYQSIN